MSLTAKQDLFVDEYLVDLNATQAAIRAGYSPRTATMQGSRLLTKANVSAAVAERRDQVARELEVTRERIAQELSGIGFASLDDAQVKVSDKRMALMDLAKILGYLVDRHDVTGRAGGPIAESVEPPALDVNDDADRSLMRTMHGALGRMLQSYDEEHEQH